MTSALPESFGAALEALAVFLTESELPAIIVGGVAASLLGRPRLTQDIDVLVDVPDEGWDRLLLAHPEADIDRVRRWVGEFAVAATMPDLLEDLDKLIGRQR